MTERGYRLVLVAALAGAAFGQTQPAAAGTALIVDSPGWGPAVGYIGAAGETNNVTMSELSSGEVVEITDTGATVNVGTGCMSITPQQAHCPWPDSEGRVLDVELADLNDSFSVGFFFHLDITFLRGGDGKDVIAGGVGFGDVLFGGPGNDTLRGGYGDDTLDGGPGADIMSGGSSIHPVHGGSRRGIDGVVYWDRVNPVRADADGVADDGEAGEGDNIRVDVESIVGGRGDDILTSGFRAHYLSGGRGDDVLLGNGGRDRLQGWAGNDILRGGPGRDDLLGDGGNDFLGGGASADLILGGWGNDVIFGGLGPDWLEGNDGEDFLLSRDGSPDVVAGGFGRDRGSKDRFDTVRGIERFLP